MPLSLGIHLLFARNVLFLNGTIDKNGNKGGTHIDSLYECSEYGFIQDD